MSSIQKPVSGTRPATLHRLVRAMPLMAGMFLASLSAVLLHTPAVQARSLDLTAEQIQRAGIVTVKPEALGKTDGNLSLNGFFVTSRTGGVAVNSHGAATVSEILKDNLVDVKAGEALLRLRSENWLQVQQAHVQNSSALNLAKQSAGRDEALFADGLISKRRLIETQGQLTMARAAYQNSRQMLGMLGASSSEIIGLESAGRLMPAITVRAPITGSVSGLQLMLGQQVAAGATLFQVNRPGAFELMLTASPEQARSIHAGQAVSLKDCLGKLAKTGRVVGVGSELNAGSQTVPVRVEFNEKGTSLACFRVNQAAQATVHVSGASVTGSVELKVPDTAVVFVGNQAYVFTKSASGFQAVAVKARRLSSNLFAVSEQSAPGSKVSPLLSSSSELANRGTALLKGMFQGLGAE